jgi:hypothetical protein
MDRANHVEGLEKLDFRRNERASENHHLESQGFRFAWLVGKRGLGLVSSGLRARGPAKLCTTGDGARWVSESVALSRTPKTIVATIPVPKMVVLLILILCVLLFGAGAVLAGFGWLVAIVATLMLLYGLIVAVAWIFVGVRDKAPALPGIAAAFCRGYARILCAPAIGPIAEWRSISERRTRGEHVGAVSMSCTLLWTFIVGLFLSWLAFVMPLLIVSVIYQASLG